MSEKSRKQAWFDSLVISKEVLLKAKSLEIPCYDDADVCLSPILENFSKDFLLFNSFEKTDLPCEDLFS